MFQCEGVWFPDGEEHLLPFLKKGPHIDGKGTYQYHKYQAVLKWTKGRACVIDVGAHVGLWSMHFAQEFQWVHAFEPVPRHIECFKKNLEFASNVLLYDIAVGCEGSKIVKMVSDPHSSGDTKVNPLPLRSADLLEYHLPMEDLDDQDINGKIDLIKLDCEGYELFALKGAQTILFRDKPTVIVEQKPNRAEQYGLPRIGAVDWLKNHGWILRETLSGDYILSL